jgi:hypothetical protein
MLQRKRAINRVRRLLKPTDGEVDPCQNVVGTPVARRGNRPRLRACKCLWEALLHHEAFRLGAWAV